MSTKQRMQKQNMVVNQPIVQQLNDQPDSSRAPAQEQNNTIQGTGEINYQASAQSNGKGPQLTYDKHELCMMTPVGKISQDRIVVTNVGSTTVTYDWKKVHRGDYIQSKNSDFLQRFYCHYPRSILKPGDSKTFTFSFRSQKPGMYFEEWEILTEPLLLQPLPFVNLSGMAVKEDGLAKERSSIEEDFQSLFVHNNASEIFEDVLDRVKTPTPPLPNMKDPTTFMHYFENNNKHLGLYFTQFTMDSLYELLEDVQARLGYAMKVNNEGAYSEWDARIEYIEGLIAKVLNPYSKEDLQKRYVQLLYHAKKIPTDRAQSYNVFRQLMLDISDSTVDCDAKAREELVMSDNFGFEVPSEDQTEEEKQKLKDEKKAKATDWLKKNKKKAKPEEEEAKDMEELKNRVSVALSQLLAEQKAEKAESEVEIVKTKWLMENHLVMDTTQYDELYRKESILDVDISGKDLILRLDLDVPLSPYTPPPPISQSQTQEDQKSQGHTKGQHQRQPTNNQIQKQETSVNQMASAKQAENEEPWQTRDILDHTLIKKGMTDIRYALEHLANRTLVISNIGEKCGKIKPENSMKIIYNVIQQQMMEQQMVFLPDAVIKDFEERKENEEYPEGCTFILENLNFKPDEFGFVEPEKPPEAPKPTQEEIKKQEEELKQQQAPQKGGKQAAAKAPSAAEKKRQEEELKKKQEEEAKKKALEAAHEKSVSEDEKAELQRQKEEAQRRKKEMEFFDYKTIDKYKEFLGKYGDIYVNDAPMMTLTNSNSIAEIKCRQKVMGIRMTEEIRKLALFFNKKYPYDIKNQYFKVPRSQTYFNLRMTAVIGGATDTPQDILDKVLLVNSLLDTAECIILVGEVGLAALYALGIQVGKVQRTEDNGKDYERIKQFFITFFQKAADKSVKIRLPCDFLCSPKVEFEESPREVSHSLTGTANLNESKQKADETQQSRISLTEQEDLSKTKISQKEVWRPQHWADKVIDKAMHKRVDLKRLVDRKLDNFIEQANRKRAENQLPEIRNYQQLFNCTDSEQPDQEESISIESEDYVLEFGEKTIAMLEQAIDNSFKLLWDGSISLFKQCILASQNNKRFVQYLQDARTKTNEDEEPPVTLLHGSETESVLRQGLTQIKVEQAQLLEEQKRIAAEEGEELEEEEEEMGLDESKDEASSMQQDLQIMGDFFCFEVPQFTMKVMQGVPNKSLYNLNTHPKRTKEKEEEDLTLLDEI